MCIGQGSAGISEAHVMPSACVRVAVIVGKQGPIFRHLPSACLRRWGLDGYFHMVRGKNMCGVADCAAFPLVP